MTGSPLLDLRLNVSYGKSALVLRELELQVHEGEIVGLAGESGSGKSTLALAILGLLKRRGAKVLGRVLWDDKNLLLANEREWRDLRGREIALVLQNAGSSLNPVLTIGKQLEEAWRAHRANSTGFQDRVAELFAEVCLPYEPEFLHRYPRQISVGQAQRILVAMAVLHRPRLLIADEPTSALDMLTQKETLELFRRLRRDNGMAILFISHDLLSIAALCDRMAILSHGAIVEDRNTRDLMADPRHPYTRALLSALPLSGVRLTEIGSSVP